MDGHALRIIRRDFLYVLAPCFAEKEDGIIQNWVHIIYRDFPDFRIHCICGANQEITFLGFRLSYRFFWRDGARKIIQVRSIYPSDNRKSGLPKTHYRSNE